MSFMGSWLFVALVFAVLWAFWHLLTETANAFSQWWNAERGASSVPSERRKT